MLPKPRAPENAVVKCASGQVTVAVLVSEQGSVLRARAVAGDRLLRRAAETAAKGAKFAAVIDAPPVKFRGIVVYNFPIPASCRKKQTLNGRSP